MGGDESRTKEKCHPPLPKKKKENEERVMTAHVGECWIKLITWEEKRLFHLQRLKDSKEMLQAIVTFQIDFEKSQRVKLRLQNDDTLCYF